LIAPHEQQVAKMLDAFRIEVLAMNDNISRQEAATKEQI
jgi:hypothetical protein